jgi:hypothetical protein
MATRTDHEGANAGRVKPRLTSERVWQGLA